MSTPYSVKRWIVDYVTDKIVEAFKLVQVEGVSLYDFLIKKREKSEEKLRSHIARLVNSAVDGTIETLKREGRSDREITTHLLRMYAYFGKLDFKNRYGVRTAENVVESGVAVWAPTVSGLLRDDISKSVGVDLDEALASIYSVIATAPVERLCYMLDIALVGYQLDINKEYAAEIIAHAIRRLGDRAVDCLLSKPADLVGNLSDLITLLETVKEMINNLPPDKVGSLMAKVSETVLKIKSKVEEEKARTVPPPPPEVVRPKEVPTAAVPEYVQALVSNIANTLNTLLESHMFKTLIANATSVSDVRLLLDKYLAGTKYRDLEIDQADIEVDYERKLVRVVFLVSYVFRNVGYNCSIFATYGLEDRSLSVRGRCTNVVTGEEQTFENVPLIGRSRAVLLDLLSMIKVEHSCGEVCNSMWNAVIRAKDLLYKHKKRLEGNEVADEVWSALVSSSTTVSLHGRTYVILPAFETVAETGVARFAFVTSVDSEKFGGIKCSRLVSVRTKDTSFVGFSCTVSGIVVGYIERAVSPERIMEIRDVIDYIESGNLRGIATVPTSVEFTAIFSRKKDDYILYFYGSYREPKVSVVTEREVSMREVRTARFSRYETIAMKANEFTGLYNISFPAANEYDFFRKLAEQVSLTEIVIEEVRENMIIERLSESVAEEREETMRVYEEVSKGLAATRRIVGREAVSAARLALWYERAPQEVRLRALIRQLQDLGLSRSEAESVARILLGLRPSEAEGRRLLQTVISVYPQLRETIESILRGLPLITTEVERIYRELNTTISNAVSTITNIGKINSTAKLLRFIDALGSIASVIEEVARTAEIQIRLEHEDASGCTSMLCYAFRFVCRFDGRSMRDAYDSAKTLSTNKDIGDFAKVAEIMVSAIEFSTSRGIAYRELLRTIQNIEAHSAQLPCKTVRR